MKNARYILLIAIAALSITSRADLMQDLLNNKYAPKTLTNAYIDSVLNGTPTDRYLLRSENATTRFRRSKEADWYLIDTEKKNARINIGRGRDAQMSPNGKYVVYVKDKTPWIYKVDFKTEVVMTHEDSEEVYGGASDWLYEEEFGVTRMFAFSPDSRMVAFIRLDETPVPTFTWQEYLDTEGNDLFYPISQSLRYPKAGEMNAHASVCVYDIQTKAIQTMKINSEEDDYIPRICWRTLPNPKAKKDEPKQTYELIVERLNRDQNKLEIIACNPRSTVCHTIYREHTENYFIDYSLFDQWLFLDNGQFIVLSERDGFRQLFLHQQDGTPVRCLTPQKRDINRVISIDQKNQIIYFEAADTPLTRQAYSLLYKKDLLTALTHEEGTHRLIIARDNRHAIDIFQSTSTPPTYTLYSLQKQQLTSAQTLLNNDSINAIWQSLPRGQHSFFSFATERGDTLNGYIIRPSHFNDKHLYPLVLLQYSGPASQRVLNRWNTRWEYALAEEGYIVAVVDPRGTDCRGRQWRNETYMQLGQKEAQDHISAALYLASLPYIDQQRMCIGGWSYGGFQAITTMSRKQSPFKCGFAIAPVTSWNLYDTGYTERYMIQPKENEKGYDDANLIKHAKDLNGRLLIVHGLADDNVHAQNTLLYINALTQAGKQYDMQLYPDDNHFLRKRNNYLHLHQRLLRFLNEELKGGK